MIARPAPRDRPPGEDIPAEATGLPVEVHPTAEAAGEAAASALDEAMATARAQGRQPLLGWPVGRTPRPVVDALARRACRAALNLADVCIALMDDYLEPGPSGGLRRVDPALGHSCRGTALRELVGPLHAVLPPSRRLAADALWSPDPEDPAAYEARIAGHNGIDVFLVALGASDGHIALNPPHSPPQSRTRIVEIAASTRADNVDSFVSLAAAADVPTHGVTVGLATITDARRLVVLAHGSGKRAAVARLRAAGGFDPALPMTALVGHRDAVLICDAAAAGQPEVGP